MLISESQERMQWVDAMRGFSMIVVVLGHVLLHMGLGGYDSFLSYLFLTFRMPLFFFVSGFFSFRAIGWWTGERVGDILKRKFQAQILCTFIFLFLYQIVFEGGIHGIDKGFEGYWFTIVLFQMYICYLVLSLLSRAIRFNITYIGLTLLSVAGIIIIAFHKGDEGLWKILSWGDLTKYFQFFALGVICSRFRDVFFLLMKNSWFIACMAVGWIGCLLLVYTESFRMGNPLVYNFVHDILIRYCALMTVVIMFFNNAKKLDYSKHGKKLQFIGRRTLDLYMIHYFFLPNLLFMEPYLTDGNMFVVQFLISGIITGIVVWLSLIVSSILRQSPFLESWLFGVKRPRLRTV